MASIIDAKYKDKYKGAKDWLSMLLDKFCTVADTKEKTTKTPVIVDGKETGEFTETKETVTLKSRHVDLDALFLVGKLNHMDMAKYEAQRDQPGAPGRLRMTVGNMLRSAAKHRHGLYMPDAVEGGSFWVDADAAFIGDSVKTHNPDGSKIVVAKEAKADEKPAEPEAEAAKEEAAAE